MTPVVARSMLSEFTTILVTSAVPISSVLPFLDRPAPAVTCPAPLNCVKARPVVPRTIAPLVVRTQPLSAFTDPSSTNVNMPAVTSSLLSASTDLSGAPLALTT